MSISLYIKGRPVHSTGKDPPIVSSAFPPVTSPQDGKRCGDTITTGTEYEARIRENQVETAETGKRNSWGIYDNERSRCNPMPQAGHEAAFTGKRKLDGTCSDSLPAAKKIHSTSKTGHEKRSATNPANKYDHLTRTLLRGKCWSRSILASGSKEDLIKRLTLDDTTRAQIPASQKHVKETATSVTPPRAEPLDRYTPMLQKDLQRECLNRSLPIGHSKKDLRFRLRTYDAARALGLTPEESLEAQRATLQHLVEEAARIVNPLESTEEDTLGVGFEEAVERSEMDHTSRMSIVNEVQGPASLGTSSSGPRASSDKKFASSPAITQDSAQDCGAAETCPAPAATPNYAAMGGFELRSLCRSRSLKHHNYRLSQLRKTLKNHDRRLYKETNILGVADDAKCSIAKLEGAPTASQTPDSFIDLDSSSQDVETLEQRARSLPISLDAQGETRQRGSMKWTSDEMLSEKDPNVSSNSLQIGPSPQEKIDTERTFRRMPNDTGSISPQQPLISLLNLTVKEAGDDACTSTPQEIQLNTKPLSEYATKVAAKAEFNARYAPEVPFWICCCVTPDYEVGQKQLAEFSGNCLYHVPQLTQRYSFTMKEYQEYRDTQQALDRKASCLCQKPAVGHPEHQVTITEGGFILTRIWREQLIRRQSLTNFDTNMERMGPLEVMHNVLEDFMIELSTRQQRRPLVLWARIEAMACFTNLLPTSNEWHSSRNRSRPCHYIMLFGIALLTTIDALLQEDLFKGKESKVPNLGLVLALFIRSTWDLPPCTWNLARKGLYKSPFSNSFCANNENGWAAEVISLADQHGVGIIGVPNIDFIVDQWRVRKKFIESKRDQARKERYARYVVQSGSKVLPPSEATLVSIAAKEGETPAKRGTGQRTTVCCFQSSFWVVKLLAEKRQRSLLFGIAMRGGELVWRDLSLPVLAVPTCLSYAFQRSCSHFCFSLIAFIIRKESHERLACLAVIPGCSYDTTHHDEAMLISKSLSVEARR